MHGIEQLLECPRIAEDVAEFVLAIEIFAEEFKFQTIRRFGYPAEFSRVPSGHGSAITGYGAFVIEVGEAVIGDSQGGEK